MVNVSLKDEIALFPNQAGIYQMYDDQKQIIYIGKAKNLRSRVRSYFNVNQSRRITHILVSKIKRIDYIVTKTEREALILENNLIKKHQPFFNIDLKDNKTYPYLWLTHEKFPSLRKTRDPNVAAKPDSLFGPFTDVSLMNTYLEVIHTLFPLKKCSTRFFPRGFKPCLYYHLGQCLDYCTGQVDSQEIKALSQEIKDLLKGKKEEILDRLRNKMLKESEKQNYERARNIKHYIDILTKLETQQSMTMNPSNQNFDVIHFHIYEKLMVIVILHFREGRLIQKSEFDFKNDLFESETYNQLIIDTLQQFLFEYYLKKTEPIKEIIIPPLFSSYQDIIESLQNTINSSFEVGINLHDISPEAKSHLKKFPPKVVSVLKGEKNRYLKLAEANARFSIRKIIKQDEKKQQTKYLKDFLKLKKTPEIIESFDIANTADKHIIAGMVRFDRGEKDKKNYRIFNITSTEFQNDFAAMEEAVYRRYKRLLKENKSFPDLIVIDGGKGQLNSAKKSLERLNIKGQPIIALAKQEEKIFVPKKSEPLLIDADHPSLRFLVEIRDETHRFVNNRHIQKRMKADFESKLDRIPGLGKAKIKTLINHFDSLEAIKLSSLENLNRLPFFSQKDAQLLVDFLKQN